MVSSGDLFAGFLQLRSSQHFDDGNHGGIIVFFHAIFEHGIEELGVDGRAGNRDAVGAGGFHDDVEVFGLHVGFEAGLAVACEQALGFIVQRPALGRRRH